MPTADKQPEGVAPSGATRWRLHIRKEAYKFSSAHMTVFPDGTKEALHGHNYQVSLDVEVADASFAKVIAFGELKAIVGPLCEAWDERILIPGANPHIAVEAVGGETTVRACGKRYVFPSDETVVLDVDNVSSESLASALGEAVARGIAAKGLIAPRGTILELTVRVDESNGQGASWARRFD
jgi:6-pyruvoyltetrahydropterin/6-carboxytetrahydropterin synthase